MVRDESVAHFIVMKTELGCCARCLLKDAEAMSMLRSRVGVAVMKNRLYAIGGYNGTERLNTVEVFDSVTKRWSRVASMNFCRR